MKDESIAVFITISYLFLCIFTFGHEYNSAKCYAHRLKVVECDIGQKTLLSLGAMMFAPLYWSQELQRK